MFARRWRLRRRASQRGSEARRGGRRGSIGPWRWLAFGGVQRKQFGGAFTPSSSRPSRRWRGTIVTVSISDRKAISEAVTPRGRGKAIEGVNRKMKAI